MRRSVVETWMKHWNGVTTYRLANEAECSCPDSSESAGARFLESVRDGIVEAVEAYDWSDNDGMDAYQDLNDDDTIRDVCDNAPSVYTARRWAEFVDLGAYEEDPTELSNDASDMTATAGVNLYLIAQRLAMVMMADLSERAAQDGMT